MNIESSSSAKCRLYMCVYILFIRLNEKKIYFSQWYKQYTFILFYIISSIKKILWFHGDFKSNLICVQNIDIIFFYLHFWWKYRWISSFSYFVFLCLPNAYLLMILGGYWFISWKKKVKIKHTRILKRMRYNFERKKK